MLPVCSGAGMGTHSRFITSSKIIPVPVSLVLSCFLLFGQRSGISTCLSKIRKFLLRLSPLLSPVFSIFSAQRLLLGDPWEVMLLVACFFPGDYCRKGRQLQRAPQSSVHQHQEQDDLSLCQLEGQRLSGAEDLWLPATDDLQNILRQRICRKLQQLGWWGWWKAPAGLVHPISLPWRVFTSWSVLFDLEALQLCWDEPATLMSRVDISFISHGVCI